MTGFWYFLGDMFQWIFNHIVPLFSGWINKALIVVGFVAFFSWLWYMNKNKEVTKWD